MNRQELADYHRKLPFLKDICNYRETVWLNPAPASTLDPNHNPDHGFPSVADIDETVNRMARFRPLLRILFKELEQTDGIIESPLIELRKPEKYFPHLYTGAKAPCRFLLKCDSELPVSGSIKARGGFHAVLKHAESIAVANGLIKTGGSYSTLADKEARKIFSKHAISVGSTGNLGLSVGILGARLGFRVFVHMSCDAKTWKKELLRSYGVNVVEHQGDYGTAVAAGRKQAEESPDCFFIDDENSVDLFLGYSGAARHLESQLRASGITIDESHPLIVYLPCGVGGGPGGITFGLKAFFGPSVFCYFVEPTHAPCMLLGLATGLHDKISVEDFGLDGKTAADGLAVARSSGFVGRFLAPWIDGVITVGDDTLYRLLAELTDHENIRLEPSALAGVAGCSQLLDKVAKNELSPPPFRIEGSTHIMWATGGSMVPSEEMAHYYRTGRNITHQ